MPRTPERPLSFGRSSHVRTYWLLHSTGFKVRGRRLRGVVETVHGPPSEAHELVVRCGALRRRIVLPADAVERVVPDEELLVVDEAPAKGRAWRTRLARPSAARVAARARDGAAAVVAGGGAGLAGAGRLGGRTGRAAAPHARAVARAVAALAAWLAVAVRELARSSAAFAAALGVTALAYARAIAELAAIYVSAALSRLREQAPVARRLLARVGRAPGSADGPRRRF